MEKEFNGQKRTHFYLPLPDGGRLSAVLFTPLKDGKEPDRPLPLILSYTAYECLHYETDEDGQKRIVQRVDFDIDTLTDYGYLVAVVQIRGCGASFGVRKVVVSRREAADGAFVVDYLAEQPYCDGNVMTAGMSYNGQSQMCILSMKPRHLKGAYIGKTDLNRYDGWVRNGIPRAFGSRPDVDWGETPQEHEAAIERVADKTVPVDDDPEGILLRQAIREHLDNGSQVTAQRDLNWRDSVSADCEGTYWQTLSASTYLKEINDSGAVVYLDGGVLDIFRRDTILLYHNLTLKKKLIIGPWDHIRPKWNPEPRFEILRFADHILKNVENGILEEKPITLRVMEYNFQDHRYWGENTGYYRREDIWPLHEGKRTVFCLDSHEKAGVIGYKAYSLHRSCPQDSELPYRASYGVTSGVETDDLLKDGQDGACGKGLNFLSDVFSSDEEYIGHPFARVTFYVEDGGNVPGPLDADIFISLSDFDPQSGEAFQFCSGWMRSSLRRPKGTPTYNFLGLPWHDCKMGDNEYLKVGEKYQLDMDMLPVFYRMRKGHRLMATLTCSMNRTYYHGWAYYETHRDCVPPKLRLRIGGEDGCRLILPNIYDSASENCENKGSSD